MPLWRRPVLLGRLGDRRTRCIHKVTDTGLQEVLPRHMRNRQIDAGLLLERGIQPYLHTLAAPAGMLLLLPLWHLSPFSATACRPCMVWSLRAQEATCSTVHAQRLCEAKQAS